MQKTPWVGLPHAAIDQINMLESDEQWQKRIPAITAQKLDEFKANDKDGDGFLTYEEFTAVYKIIG